MSRECPSARCSVRSLALVVGALVCLTVTAPGPASALVVNPHFSGSQTIDRFTQIFDYRVDAGFEFEPGRQQIDIDVDHGMVDDGGLISRVTPGQWEFDMNVWAPLMCNYDIQQGGGVVTYGNPAPSVFAVTWVNMPMRDAPSLRNTFQVVFVGDTGYHTNTGLAIPPGSVIFAYGAPTDPSGTVHLAPGVDAAIGILRGGLTTLSGLNVGGSTGLLLAADESALQNSGDPFLFQPAGNGVQAPIAFASVPELGGTSGVPGPTSERVSLAAAPNPARGAATLTYTLAREGRVRLAIYDLGGRLVATLADGVETAGAHQSRWNARTSEGARVTPGVYLARLSGAGAELTRRLVVVD